MACSRAAQERSTLSPGWGRGDSWDLVPAVIRDLDLLGVPVRLDVSDVSLASRVGDLLSDFPLAQGDSHRALTLVREDVGHDRRFSLRESDRLIRGSLGPAEAVAMLLWQLNQIALETTDYLVLHAGCVARDRYGIVLSAPMEAGKSTLVTALVLGGFDYLSDEFAAVSLDGRQLRPYPCPITLDWGSFPLFPGLAPQLPAEFRDPARWHVRASDIRSGSQPEAVRIGAVVLPQYRARARCELVRLEPKVALVRLIEQRLNLGDRGPSAFHLLSALVRNTPAFSLEFGDLDEACAALVRATRSGHDN